MQSRHLAFPSSLALLSALCMAAQPLRAQEMTNPSNYSAAYGIAAGVLLPTGDISDVQSTGWNVQGFVDWMSKAQPYGVRADISYGGLSGKTISADGVVIGATDLRLFSVTADGVWMFRPTPGSRSRTTPYILAGIGFYRADYEVRSGDSVDDRGTSNFGINFGGGLLYRFDSFQAFGEIRYHNVFNGAANGSAHYIPIMVGLRFHGAR